MAAFYTAIFSENGVIRVVSRERRSELLAVIGNRRLAERAWFKDVRGYQIPEDLAIVLRGQAMTPVTFGPQQKAKLP
jgi:hypothetical protein